MELRTLRAFVEVVRQHGFSQAAKTVFATQSTVSKAVRQLEDELGHRLLDRLDRRCELTAAGEIVYRRALTMLAERDDPVVELDELRGLKRGVLRLGLPPLGSNILIAPAFAAYRSRYPGIEVRLVERGSKRLENMLLAGEIDIGASLLPVPDAVEHLLVRSEPIMALMASGHELAQRDKVDLATLAGSPFVLFEAEFAITDLILNACRRTGVVPRIAAQSRQLEFVTELIAAGLGIGFLPRLIAEERPHSGVRCVLLDDPDTRWDFVLVWRRGGYLPHAARAWLELVCELNAPA